MGAGVLVVVLGQGSREGGLVQETVVFSQLGECEGEDTAGGWGGGPMFYT